MHGHMAVVRDEHGYALSPAEALRWAIDDCGPGPITPGVETDASLGPGEVSWCATGVPPGVETCALLEDESCCFPASTRGPCRPSPHFCACHARTR